MEKLKTQKGKKDSKVKAEAEKIYKKYLQRGAVYEINLGPDVKRQIDKDIQGMAQKLIPLVVNRVPWAMDHGRSHISR